MSSNSGNYGSGSSYYGNKLPTPPPPPLPQPNNYENSGYGIPSSLYPQIGSQSGSPYSAPPPPYIIQVPYMEDRAPSPPGYFEPGMRGGGDGSLGTGVGYLEPMPPQPYKDKKKHKELIVVAATSAKKKAKE